jgi:hypothetical protein
MFRSREMTVVLLFGLGCQIGPQGTRYRGGDGASLATSVVIEGARGNKAVLAAEQAWIRRKFPAALLQRRAVAVDPLTSEPFILPPPRDSVEETAPGSSSVNLDPTLWYEWVEYRTRNGDIKSAYFSFGFDALGSGKSVEDLGQLYRCIDLLQQGHIHRGMTTDELRRVMTRTYWIDGDDFHIQENEGYAYLSEWKSDTISLGGQLRPVWSITFKITEDRLADFELSKPGGKVGTTSHIAAESDWPPLQIPQPYQSGK